MYIQVLPVLVLRRQEPVPVLVPTLGASCGTGTIPVPSLTNSSGTGTIPVHSLTKFSGTGTGTQISNYALSIVYSQDRLDFKDSRQMGRVSVKFSIIICMSNLCLSSAQQNGYTSSESESE